MSSEHPLLDIHIHNVSGQITKFAQDDPNEVKHILDGLGQPSRLFLQPQFIIGGDQSMSVFRSHWVTRLDLIGERLPHWPFLQGASNVQEITEDMFRLRYEPDRYAAARHKAWAITNETQMGFTEIEMTTGQHLFWEVLTQSRTMVATDLNPYVQTLLGSGGLHAQREGSGIMIINPANITRLTFHPGPPQLPPNAWKMNRLSGPA